MSLWLLGLFLIAHGLVHAAVWLTPNGGPGPSDPAHSWALGGLGLGDVAARVLSMALAMEETAGFVLVGIGLLPRRWWSRPEAAVVAAAGLGLIVLFFDPWLSVGLAIEIAILAALLTARWPAEEPVGAKKV